MASRHTITLEADVLAKIKAEMRRNGTTFKQAVNTLLRQAESGAPKGKPEPFKIKAKNLGRLPGLNYDNIEALLDYAEGPWRK